MGGLSNQMVLVLVVVFALGWMAQMYFAGRQTQGFMRTVRALRAEGDTATGRAKRGWRGHVFVVLAADVRDRVVGARELSGMTLFARAKDYSEPIGHDLEDVAGWSGSPHRDAAAQAARFLLGVEDDTGPAPAFDDDMPPTHQSTHLPDPPRRRGDVRATGEQSSASPRRAPDGAVEQSFPAGSPAGTKTVTTPSGVAERSTTRA